MRIQHFTILFMPVITACLAACSAPVDQILEGHSALVRDVVFSPDGGRVH